MTNTSDSFTTSQKAKMMQHAKLQISEEEYEQIYEESRLSLQKRLQPKTLDAYIGQFDVVGENGSISHYLNYENIDKIPSMLLWGPPGVGKTSLADIILNSTTLLKFRFSATIDSINDIKPVLTELKNKRNKAVIFVDEIHRYSKTQQTFLLDAVDSGFVTLIGATTENPSFNLIKPLTSRCLTVCLHPHNLQEIKSILSAGIRKLNETRVYVYQFPKFAFDDEAIEYIAKVSNGDLRNALKLLDISFVLCTEFDPVTNQVIDSEPYLNNILNGEKDDDQKDQYKANKHLVRSANEYGKSSIMPKNVLNDNMKMEYAVLDNDLQNKQRNQTSTPLASNDSNMGFLKDNDLPPTEDTIKEEENGLNDKTNEACDKVEHTMKNEDSNGNILNDLDNTQIFDSDQEMDIGLGNDQLFNSDTALTYPSTLVTKEKLESIVALNYINFDTKGDSHYDTISAFHKSVRGSDCNATLYYLMRMLYGGDDPLYVCRRMIRIASEDIGIVDNTMFEYCCDVYKAVEQMGMPKCIDLMAQCATRLARSPKSVAIYRGWNNIKAAVQSNKDLRELVPEKLMVSTSKLRNRFIGTDIEFADLSYNEEETENNKIEFEELMPERFRGQTFILEDKHLGTEVDGNLGIEWSDSEDEFKDEGYYNNNDNETE